MSPRHRTLRGRTAQRHVAALGLATLVILAPSAAFAADINGDGGDNELVGTGGSDTIDGRGGDDTIRGAGGADDIGGGNGDDDIRGGPGQDVINGGPGDDTIDGGRGGDDIDGGPGQDDIRGGNGDDVIRGGAEDDVIRGGRGDDDIDGGNGNDFLCGGAGENLLLGGRGEDLACSVGDAADAVETTPGAGASGSVDVGANDETLFDEGLGDGDLLYFLEDGTPTNITIDDNGLLTFVDLTESILVRYRTGRLLDDDTTFFGNFVDVFLTFVPAEDEPVDPPVDTDPVAETPAAPVADTTVDAVLPNTGAGEDPRVLVTAGLAALVAGSVLVAQGARGRRRLV